MKQLEFEFNGNIPTFQTFLDNCTLGDTCYCGKKKTYPKLFYCSLDCYLNNARLLKETEGRKLLKADEQQLVKNWNESVEILKEEERLLTY